MKEKISAATKNTCREIEGEKDQKTGRSGREREGERDREREREKVMVRKKEGKVKRGRGRKRATERGSSVRVVTSVWLFVP